ncbi:transcriptional repressor CTCF-like [Contarinia nasturtii]|uniref:transcriptional repressor CTCF-like n=1 Tax=Contarinia nasturtii TaxID=265458 RepID=UPI0012D3BDBE|nr:transcriptional repressor CTCF-like [Contarinia nasturtii]
MRELKKTDTEIELSTTKSASTGDNSSKGASNEKSNEQRPPKKSICNKRKRLMHKCDQCDYQSDHKGHFTRHIEMHQKKPFRCERCRKSFADQELFDIHMKGHENQCTKCLSVFGNKLAMKEHEKHCNRRNYQCYLCKYTTVKRTDFMAHMSTHTGNRPFKCQHCKADFTTNSHLKRHKKNVHKLS